MRIQANQIWWRQMLFLPEQLSFFIYDVNRDLQFADSTLLQEIQICIPPEETLYKAMAIDSKYNLYFSIPITQAIHCFNLSTKEEAKSHHIPDMYCSRFVMLNEDEKLIIISESKLYILKD